MSQPPPLPGVPLPAEAVAARAPSYQGAQGSQRPGNASNLLWPLKFRLGKQGRLANVCNSPGEPGEAVGEEVCLVLFLNQPTTLAHHLLALSLSLYLINN